MVFNMFKRKNQVKSVDTRLAVFSGRISDAFTRLRDDMSSSEQRLNSTEKELEKLNQWVGYLYQSQQHISNNHSKLAEKHSQLHNNYSKLSRSHTSLSKTIDLKHAQMSSDLSGINNLSSREFENLKDWVKHFSEKVEVQRDVEGKLRKDVLGLQTQLFGVMSELREEISNLKSENEQLKTKIVSVEKKTATPQVVEKVVEVEKSAPALVYEEAPMPPPAHNKFEQHVLARVRPNRKNFVMQQVLDLIEDNKYSTREVEDIIVNEKQLCGRTSFYSYLRELKHRGKINYADIGEKTILVMTKEA